jgi:hypothetical protein
MSEDELTTQNSTFKFVSNCLSSIRLVSVMQKS